MPRRPQHAGMDSQPLRDATANRTLVAARMADALAGKFGPGHAKEVWFPPR